MSKTNSTNPISLVVFDLDTLVSRTCNICNGKGTIVYRYSVGVLEDETRLFCSCVTKSYARKVRRSLSEHPCPFCHRIGDYCEHRPKDWDTYIAKIKRIAISDAPSDTLKYLYPPRDN